MIYEFGVPVITISDLVENFNLEQGNMHNRHFLKTLAHAKWVWKELFLRSLWGVRQVVLKVDEHGNIKLPYNMQGQVSISIVDYHGNLHQVGYNPNMNTVEITCPAHTCSCTCKGMDTLCGSFDDLVMSTETIVIKGEDYIQTKWVRNAGNGEVKEYTKRPVWVASGPDDEGEVQYIEEAVTLCDLAVTTEGCIRPTEENRRLFKRWCGCYVALPFHDIWDNCTKRYDAAPPEHSHYGEWNWNAAAGDIIHVKHLKADKVIVTLQTSGEVEGQEIAIPEYALTAMQAGIINRQEMFKPGNSDSAKRSAERVYNRETTALNQFLRPINMKVLSDLQTGVPKW